MTPERIEEFFKRYYFTDNEAESIAIRDLALDGMRHFEAQQRFGAVGTDSIPLTVWLELLELTREAE